MCAAIDFWDDLAESNRTWLYTGLKSLSLTNNAKIAQSERHETVTQEMPEP